MSLIVALIIGTSERLEEEIAYQLMKKGVCLLFCSDDENKLKTTIQKLNEERIEPKFISLEPIDTATVGHVAAQVNEQFGKLDILINVGILLDDGRFRMHIFSRPTFEAKHFLIRCLLQRYSNRYCKNPLLVVSSMSMVE